MRKLRMMTLLPALFMATSVHAASGDGPVGSNYDNGIPKIEYRPITPEINLRGQALAEAYLRENASRYGLPKDASNLKFVKEQHSAAGTHYHFQQVHEGVVVDKAQVVVTLDPSHSTVMMVYNSAFPHPIEVSTKPAMSVEAAYDLVWKDLAPRKGLLADPSAILKLRPEGTSARLVYEVTLSIGAPHGSWEYIIDAKTGAIIEKRDRNIYRRPVVRQKAEGAILDRVQAFKEWRRRQIALENVDEGEPFDGTALVFDPNPRVTLKRFDIQDDSDGADFDDAYVERPLLGITKRSADIFLEGPWVRIEDFDSPDTVPSNSKSGKWEFKRGENAFNDVMTYFHIDQNQRYIQSLGFKGETGIQAAPIKVDTDGANGADNSYFMPTKNSLAFGHGCVDDNEDSDVILHEYGHAVQWGINNSWDGGDTGAMGEGFGDYWAASYRLSTPNGADYYPAQVFTWDGHGDGSKCWPGRVLDATHLRYDPSRRYPAHGTIGSNSTDELWSTPLFQALLVARSREIPREEMDRIILQAHFGLGSGITMREMANAIINAAETLHPGGEHAGIFRDQFQKMGIIDLPAPRFEILDFEIEGAGDDGVIDPGDQASLVLRLKNAGNKEASEVRVAVATTRALVTVTLDQSELGTVGIGAEKSVRFNLVVGSELSCGEKIPLTLSLRHKDGEASLPLTLNTGRAQGLDMGVSPMVAIPDNHPDGVVSTLESKASGVVTDDLNVDVVIKHTYPRDLEVQLISPSGKALFLSNRAGSYDVDDIVGNYPRTLTPSEPLSALLGEPLEGAWKLKLVDVSARDDGMLESWHLNNVTSYECTAEQR